MVLQKKYGKSAGFGLHMMCVWKKGSQVVTCSAKLQLILAHQSFEHRFSANIYYLVPWNRQAAAPSLQQNSYLCRKSSHVQKKALSLGPSEVLDWLLQQRGAGGTPYGKIIIFLAICLTFALRSAIFHNHRGSLFKKWLCFLWWYGDRDLGRTQIHF